MYRFVQAIGDNPFKSVLVIAALYATCILLTERYFFHWILWDIPTDADSVLGDLNLVLMASQAAIFGMVYPMIIGLVAHWASRRALNNIVFDSYLADAFIRPLGVSGLSLLCILVVNAFLLDQLSSETYLIISLLNATWFVMNLVGTARFLWVTREYLRTTSLLNTVKRYSANIAWRREFEGRMKSGIWTAATHPEYALLPDPNSYDVGVNLGYALGKRGSVLMQRKFRRDVVLKDVRFWLLRLVVHLWIAKVRLAQGKDENPHQKPSLNIPIQPDFPITYEAEWEQKTTIVSEDNIDTPEGFLKRPLYLLLNSLLRLLLRWVFKFRRSKQPESKDGAGDILAAYSDAVVAAIQANRMTDFEQYWDEQIAYHGFLLNLCREGDQSTPYHNLAAKLGDRAYFSTRPISVEWVWFYDNIFEEGINRSGIDERHFRHFCYGTSNLLGQVINHAPKEVVTDVFMLHTNLHKQLGVFWQSATDEEGLPPGSHLKAYNLSGRASIRYPSLCRYFIAGWESAYSRIQSIKLTGLKNRSTAQNHRHSLLESYLERTAFMLMRSVSVGDTLMADWVRDSFMRTLKSIEMQSHNMSYLATSVLTELVTQPLLLDDVQYRKWHAKYIEEFRSAENQQDLPNLLKFKALENYHKDLLLMAMLILIDWGGTEANTDQSDDFVNPSLMIARKILQASPKDNTGRDFDIPNYFRSPSDVMSCFLRIMASGERYQENTYRNQVNASVQDIERLIQPSMISGRIYSSSHYDDVQNYPIATLVMLLFLAPDEEAFSVIQGGWQRCFEGNQTERMRQFAQSLLDCLDHETEKVRCP